MMILVVLLFGSVILYDVFTKPSAVDKRTKILYYSLMLISFVILILYTLDIPVPSPSEAIMEALDALMAL